MSSVFDPIVGKKIGSMRLVDGELRVKLSDGTKHRFIPAGGFGGTCWIESVEGLDLMVGATVLGGENKGWRTSNDEHDYSVLEAGFYSMHTDHGTLDVELRVGHNGFYGGSLEHETEEISK